MKIEFDPDKDTANCAKHGVSLALASELDWDTALVWVDDRFDYDEMRMIALAPKTETLFYVAFVDCGEVCRIISLRRASAKRPSTMSKALKRPAIRLPSLKEDKKIRAAAKSDPDAQPLTASQLKAMAPGRAVRGRPKSENKKELVSVRYSPEVISYFKSTGAGWQAKMDSILRNYVARHSKETS